MFLTALFLGVLEGMTEFIPVSSTGHLILFGHLLGFESEKAKTFEIVIQLGAIFAVCWLYRQKLWGTTIGMVRGHSKDWHFFWCILAGILPAMVAGLLFHEYITSVLFNPLNVAIMLIIGGIVILLIERLNITPRIAQMNELSILLCLKIGLCQSLALIPGTSRSGATIMGGVLLGVERKVATEFSFFLAIPTMFAATFFNLYVQWHALNFEDLQLIMVGFIAAFFSALLVVKAVVHYIGRHGFSPFGWYRIMFGTVMLIYLYQA